MRRAPRDRHTVYLPLQINPVYSRLPRMDHGEQGRLHQYPDADYQVLFYKNRTTAALIPDAPSQSTQHQRGRPA